MNTPKRIQLSRKKGWRMPANTVIVDRRTKWGNPYFVKKKRSLYHVFKVTEHGAKKSIGLGAKTQREALAIALNKFRKIITYTLRTSPDYLEPLRGKNLACWCKEEAPCHADILIELANRKKSHANTH